MTRRMLSTAVQVKAAPTEAVRNAAILGGTALTAYQPTDSDMRDAIGRLTKALEDMRLERVAGGAEWEAVDLGYGINVTHEGEVVLRGNLTIERRD